MKQIKLRNAFCGVLGVVFCSYGSAALAQSEQGTVSGCALREPARPRPRGHGIILGFQTAGVARADIPRREARRGGALDQRYLSDLRAVVKQDNGIIDIFDVPRGMTAHVGDRVKLQGSYRSTASACSYIPILIVPTDAPVA